MQTTAGLILSAAFRRSLGHEPHLDSFIGGHIMLCGETSSWSASAPFRGKVVVFGAPTEAMLPALGLRHDASLPSLDGADACPPACGDVPFTESVASLAYAPHGLLLDLANHLRRRPFCRFDYADEWNNLGFGRIRTDNSPWAVCQGFRAESATELGAMRLRGDDGITAYCGSYLTLYDTAEASVLWCARPAGPVDSTEWSIVERFLRDWRADDMPCLPVLCQVPEGCRCLVTMRLDCDEAVASAADMFDWHNGEGLQWPMPTNLAQSAFSRTFLPKSLLSG